MKLYKDNIDQFDLDQAREILANYYGVSIDSTAEAESTESLLDIAQDQGIWIPKDQIEDIIDTIYDGQWDDAGNAMLNNGINPNDVADYIEKAREERPEIYSFFSLGHATSLASTYYMLRGKAK